MLIWIEDQYMLPSSYLKAILDLGHLSLVEVSLEATKLGPGSVRKAGPVAVNREAILVIKALLLQVGVANAGRPLQGQHGEVKGHFEVALLLLALGN